MDKQKILTNLINYLRLDDVDNETTSILNLFIDAAISTAHKAGVPQTDEIYENPLFEMLLLITCSHWYDNRGISTTAETSELPIGANWIIQQLR